MVPVRNHSANVNGHASGGDVMDQYVVDEDVTIGIDLGTTFSCVGVYQNGKVVIIPNEYGSRITASCVSFSGDKITVGDDAKEQSAQNAETTIFEAKRLMGRRFNDDKVQRDHKFWPVRVVDEKGKPVFEVTFEGRKRKFSPEEISGYILSKMKEIAENYLFGPSSRKKIRNAVITVPAYFTDTQLTATRAAARLAQLNVKKLLSEPVAAAIAYAMDYVEEHKQRNILVFDLGGGTYDVTILQIEGNEFVVKAKGGDSHLGGADFDNKLVEKFADEILEEYDVDITKISRAMRRLKYACEMAKIKLSTDETTTIEIESLFKVFGEDDKSELKYFTREVTRSEFQDLCFDLFQQTIEPIEQVLADAGFDFKDIDDLVLVGGSTRIPKIQQMIRDIFAGKELVRNIHANEAVAIGAVTAAGLYSHGSDPVALNIRDVTALSLGVRVAGGLTDVIIPKTTEVPAEKPKLYTTTYDNQTSVTITVVQGERVMADDNTLIGELVLDDIPPQEKGKPMIKVTFKIDEDNILSVMARDLDTDVRKRLTIRNALSLSEEEITVMLEQAERYRERDEEIRERIAIRNELHSLIVKEKNSNPRLVQQMKILQDWWSRNVDADSAQLNQKRGIIDALKGMSADPQNEKCLKLHPCAHLCCGQVNEENCIPCLYCSPLINQKANDNCIICPDVLSSIPVIQLKCGHVYHAECVRDLLQKRYPGPRISFRFMECPICQDEIDHPSLTDILQPIRRLKDEVMKKAANRLKEMKQDRAAEIHRPGGRFFKNPTGYAMHKYAYYQCSKCTQSYYGGEASCDLAAAVFNPNEVLCVRCSSNGNIPVCEKHGPEFQGYKCRYCCSMAIFYCFGTTHFCERCHSAHERLMQADNHPACPVAPGGVALAAGSPCPLRIPHKPTGEECYLGCVICLEKAYD